MTTLNTPTEASKTKRGYMIKGAIILLLIIFLMIPTFMINSLVSERMIRQDEAYTEVSSKWADAQTISGPIISVPYLEMYKDTSGKVYQYKHYIRFLPENLKIDGNISPQKRNRGIYQLVVYSSQLRLSGDFLVQPKDIKSIPSNNILWNEAQAIIGLSDLRGIEDKISLQYNQEQGDFNSGSSDNQLFSNSVFLPIHISLNGDSAQQISFSTELHLKGSRNIMFTPLGRETNVSLQSTWANPSFDGAFLPDSHHITDKGFTANWKVLQLNRNYPQVWIKEGYDIVSSNFGLNLLLSVDNYTKTDRALKYAILFISLTFLIFFFLELLNNKSIHPLQYILVGFALCIFFVLLLSISEYLHFNLAYIIAAIMTVGLIWWYAKSILGETKLANLVGGNLLILYTFIFSIIQLQDFALLMGSFGLFIILAIVMYYSKKIDWSGVK